MENTPFVDTFNVHFSHKYQKHKFQSISRFNLDGTVCLVQKISKNILWDLIFWNLPMWII
jgi:hypothetical protein